MKLYYMPGACSLAVHIALHEIGAAFDIEKVDGTTKRTDGGSDYLAINPNGYVPALELDDGEVLVEAPAILQYLADQNPAANLAPANATLSRARLQQHLNFTASELHKSFGPFFSGQPLEGPARDAAVARVARRLDFIEGTLADGRTYLLGETFSVADTYTYVVSGWAEPVGIGLTRWPHVAEYVRRIGERPAVQKAARAEGLVG